MYHTTAGMVEHYKLFPCAHGYRLLETNRGAEMVEELDYHRARCERSAISCYP